jgi:hypothetical protein
LYTELPARFAAGGVLDGSCPNDLESNNSNQYAPSDGCFVASPSKKIYENYCLRRAQAPQSEFSRLVGINALNSKVVNNPHTHSHSNPNNVKVVSALLASAFKTSLCHTSDE